MAVTTTLAIPDQIQTPPARVVLNYFPFKPQRQHLWIGLNFALMFVVIWKAIDYGLIVRRMAWEDATQVHFRISLNNAIKWGHETNEDGILHVYQKIINEYGDDLNQEPGDGRLALDYPPLRLLIMSKWEAWTEDLQRSREIERIKKIRPVTKADLARIDREFMGRNLHWQNDYEFNRPVLELNTACEFAGAVAMFLLVHYWLRQCSGAPSQQWIDPLRCAWPALFSALLVWFSPALIFNAHSYPQWDAWIVAPFLLAVYFGMLDMWLISGILIGTVSMGKGQILLVTPALVIWQLLMMPAGEIRQRCVGAFHAFQKNEPVFPHLLDISQLILRPFGVILRLGIGIVLAIALVASPWLTGALIAQNRTIWLIMAQGLVSFLFFILEISQLITWPFGAIVRFGIGITVAIGLVASPWLSEIWAPHEVSTWLIAAQGAVSVTLFFMEIFKLIPRSLGAMLQLGVAILLAITLDASPWFSGAPVAQNWMFWLLAALGVLSMLFFIRQYTPTELYIQAGVLLVALFMVIWPWLRKSHPDFFGRAFLAFIGFAVAARYLPRRWAFTWAAGAVAIALYSCVPLFDTSMAWYTIGIKFPTQHWQLMYWCHAMNLGAILNTNYHWEFTDTVNLTDYLPFLQTWSFESANHLLFQMDCDWRLPFIPMRCLMTLAYFVTIFLCAIGMAIHTRRKSRMFFFAMVAPWVLMYALLPQMQNRYSLWAAVFAASTASFSLDGFMLFLLLNGLNVVDTAWDMMYRAQNTDSARKWMPYIGRDEHGQPIFGGIGPLFPDLGWAALLLAAIYLYLSLRRDRRRQLPVLPAPPVPIPAFASPSGGFEVVDPHVRGAIA